MEAKPPAPPAALATPMPARRHPAPVAVKHLAVQQGRAERAARAAAATLALIGSGRIADCWPELVPMQQAIAEQLRELTVTWLDGLAAWSREWAETRAANTMSKLAEQELDLLVQLGQLVSGQTTALVGLVESAEVAYGYWVSEKLAAPPAAEARPVPVDPPAAQRPPAAAPRRAAAPALKRRAGGAARRARG